MKKLIFGLFLLAIVASSYGVYRNFSLHHRARNSQAPRPEIIIYTHSSFMNPFGPGAQIAEEFAKICLCDIKYIDSGGGQVLLQKLKLAQNVDVVLGLDQVSLKEAAQNIKWRELTAHQRDWNETFLNNKYKTFLPYDWAPVGFIYRDKNKSRSEASLNDFLNQLPDKSLSLQDPRQSSLGLQLVYWAYLEAGKDLDQFSKIAKVIHKKTSQVSPDWSGSYGVFKRGQSPYVLSFMTSPLYHLKAEQDPSYKSVLIEAGHPIHIEYAAVPDICRSCGLAKRFVEFMSSDFVQRILYEKNYMLPVVNGVLPPEEESKLPKTKALSSRALDDFVDQKEEILSRWNLSAN